MAEEIHNSSIMVPRSIMISLIVNGVLGFAMVLAYLFCIGDLTMALDAQQTLGYPFLWVFQNSTRSTAGAVVMAMIIVVLGVCSTVGTLASSSRMIWSFARDHGVPFWSTFVKLDPRTSVPLWAVAVTAVISMLLSLIVLGSSTAFSNIVNLSVTGLYASYFIVCALLLWRRLQSDFILPYSAESSVVGPESLQWGPWRVPEPLGTANNIFACLYLLLVWFWAFWPPGLPVVASNMNFSVVTWGGTLVLAIAWYLVKGRKSYSGPIVEI